MIKILANRRRFIAALIIYTVLMLALWFGYHRLTYESVSRTSRENAELAADKLLEQVSAEFMQMRNIASVIAGSASVQDFLAASPDMVDLFYGKAGNVSEIIQKTAFPISSIDSVISINADGIYYRFTGSLSNNSCSELFEKFKSAGTSYNIIELDEVLYFCHIAPVYASSEQEPRRVGIIIMLTNLGRIRKSLFDNASLTVVDTAVVQDNIILLSNNEELENRSNSALHDKYGMVSRKNISGTGLSIAAAVKSEDLFPESSLFWVSSFILLAILLATIIIFYRYLSERQKLFDTEILNQNMQIGLLNSQMDAHFIVNSVTSIRALSMRGDNEKAGCMADGLAQLLKHRHGGDSDSMCGIFDELEMTDKYISVMNIRHDDKFSIEYDIDDALDAYIIPAFILQPIIENALTHGLQNKSGEAKLKICGCMLEDNIYIEISDNGSGIKPEKLEELRIMLESRVIGRFPAPGLSGVALSNIQRRIRLKFGFDYGLSIESAPGSGASVKIKLPAIKSGE